MFQFPIPEIQFPAVVPLLIVALTGLLALVIEILSPRRDNTLMMVVSVAGLLCAGATIVFTASDPAYDTVAGMITHDVVGGSLQLVIVLSTALVVLFSDRYLRQKRVPFSEFYPLVLWSATGAMIMVSTTNLLMIFLGLEILSIALYVMACLSRSEEKSEESAMKYFLLGSFASGFLLYGIAFIYGGTGGLQLEQIPVAWSQNHAQAHLLISCGMCLMLVGLSFKSAFVPFHQWTPDVYQGAPTNVTAFMATVSKVGALGALWRVLDNAGILSHLFVPVLGAIAILTMLVGNVAALAQGDVKRVLAYSSIAHAGYVLVALIAHGKMGTGLGNATLCYYLLSYCLMTVGSFAIIATFAKGGRESTSYDDLRGLWGRSKPAAICLVVFMLSLIGLPVFAGFFGKLFVLKDALQSGLAPLAIVLAVSSIISVAYYLRVAWTALTPDESTEARTSPFAGTIAFTAVLCAVGVIATGLFYTPLMQTLNLTGAKAMGTVAQK
jgi:NADH-quinone oxidoreductase subunit N